MNAVTSRCAAWILALVRILYHGYKRFISPLLGNVCRFEPYCSDYAMEAFEVHGIIRGSWLTLKRLARCQPWCQGGHDPVPPPRRK